MPVLRHPGPTTETTTNTNDEAMGKYGQAAEIAAQLLAKQTTVSPRTAWDSAVARVFPENRSLRTKGCPRNSFLGLCEMGVVKNVVPGIYTRSIKNKGYAVRALAALRDNPALSEDERGLWRIVTDGAEKAPNHQMDVVTTLFRKGFIRYASE